MSLKKNKVYALIPARSGSKGVIHKNIKSLGGIPLIAYSIIAAKKCSSIDRVIVSTDSDEYAKIAQHYGAEVPFIRPKNISKSESTDLQFFKHAIDYFRETENFVPEYFAHIRPTSPLRYPSEVDKAINFFLKSNYSALRSVHLMSETSYKTFEIENKKLKTLCTGSFDIESTNQPRQSFPKTYNPNGYIDLIRTSMIDNGVIHGNNVYAFITAFIHDIDEQVDFDLLDLLVKNNPNCISHLFEENNE
jgi:CMP-N,N'-diacetyllegionaminic acid synthase